MTPATTATSAESTRGEGEGALSRPWRLRRAAEGATIFFESWMFSRSSRGVRRTEWNGGTEENKRHDRRTVLGIHCAFPPVSSLLLPENLRPRWCWVGGFRESAKGRLVTSTRGRQPTSYHSRREHVGDENDGRVRSVGEKHQMTSSLFRPRRKFRQSSFEHL